jgi:hypothetical protein
VSSPDQPAAEELGLLEHDEVARAIFTVLLDRHPSLVSLEELTRFFDHHERPEDRITPLFVREGVDELRRMGLVHQVDQFAFASYSAVRAAKLAG